MGAVRSETDPLKADQAAKQPRLQGSPLDVERLCPSFKRGRAALPGWFARGQDLSEAKVDLNLVV